MFSKLLLVTLFAASNAHAVTAPNYWPQMTQADLDFIHATLQQNHPGAIDTQAPGFKRWMNDGYAAASASARKAASLPDMKRILSRYMAGFADGHLALDFAQQSSYLNWPGIVVSRIGTRYMVSGLAQDWPAPLPAMGAELMACDGRAPDTIMNEDILPALFNLTTLDSVKYRHTVHLFQDQDTLPHQYASCVFSQAGERKQFALQWRETRRSAFAQQWEAANPRPPNRSSITQVGPGSWWVHLPEFNPDRAAEVELQKIIADMPSLRSAQLVVFDLRGNNGGNSQWGDDVLAGLYGKPYMDHRTQLQNDKKYTEWRVSQANLKHVEAITANQARQFGAQSEVALTFSSLARRMRAALKAGQPFVRQDEIAAAPAAAAVEPPALSKARAILVTDAKCASSCLDGADAVLSLPGARHFGQTTGADTVYMDVRMVDLPSKLGELVFALKVDRHGLRDNNQPWVPSLQYDGQIGDTEKLRSWVLENAL